MSQENNEINEKVQDNTHAEKLELKQTESPEKPRYSMRTSILLMVGTLIVSLVVGYVISSQFIWKDERDRSIDATLKQRIKEVDDSPNDPNARVQLGYIYYLKGDYSKAIEQNNIAIDLDEDHFPAYLNNALAYLDQEKFEDALTAASTAERLSPMDAKPKLIRGICLRELKRLDQAKEAIAEAQRLDPSNVEAVFQAGLVAEAQGDIKEAVKIFEEALSMRPTFKEAREALDRVQGK